MIPKLPAIRKISIPFAILVVIVLTFSACGGELSAAQMLHNEGAELHDNGRLEEAIPKYDQALILDPQLVFTHIERGDAYFDLEEFDSAIEDYSTVIRLDTRNHDVYNKRGFVYYTLGQYEKAVDDFNESVILERRFAAGYANRALAHTQLGMDDQVKEDVQLAAVYGFDQDDLEAQIEEIKAQR